MKHEHVTVSHLKEFYSLKVYPLYTNFCCWVSELNQRYYLI